MRFPRKIRPLFVTLTLNWDVLYNGAIVMKKILIQAFLFVFSCSALNQHGRLDYNNLFAIMGEYKKVSGNWHRGHLFEHSVWTAKAMDQMFQNNSWWLKGIDPSERRLMVLAAFMHDIGKAGDLEFEYGVKIHHPKVGFEYIMGTRPFYSSEDEMWDIQAWLKHHELTEDEIKTLAVLVGMHQEFGKVLFAFKKSPDRWAKAREKFFDDLLYYVQESGYNNGIPDERIITMSVAICRADGEALYRVDYESPTFPELPHLLETREGHRPVPVSFVDAFGIPFFFYSFLPYCLERVKGLSRATQNT